MSFGLSLLDATTRPGSVVVLIPDSATIEQLPVAAQDKACLPAGQPFNVHFKEDLRREAHPALSPVRDFPAREYYFDDLSTCTIGPPLLAWSEDVAPVAAGLAARSIVIEANSWFGYHRPENSELDYRSPVLLKVDLADRTFALAASAPSPNSSATSTSGTWNIPRRSTTIKLRFGDRVALLLAELAPAAFSLGMGILLGSVDYSSLRRGRASR